MLNYTTKIPAHQSIAEISRLLAKAGARAIMQEYDEDGMVKSLSFSLVFNGNTIGFRLPVNWQAIHTIVNNKNRNPNWRPWMGTNEHAINVAWRIIKDWVEAQLALIEANQVTIEQVFLPYAITAEGKTLYEQIASDPRLLLRSGSS